MRESGQATVALAAMLAIGCSMAVVLLGVGKAATSLSRRQAVADASALAGAKGLIASGVGTAVADAGSLASINGADRVKVSADPATGRVKVRVEQPIEVGFGGASVTIPAVREAVAEAAASALSGLDPGPGDYAGPFAWRQGKPMRPDVAIAFDRMAHSAAAAGLRISITSAWRSSAEQARLFSAHPDPRWVARPGHSLHRLGTELDLGPRSAWGWLSANAHRFGFARRYPWEQWHFGYVRSPGSTSVGFGRPPASSARRSREGALQVWVPDGFRHVIIRASISHGVSAALLAAQIRAESDFDPKVVSSAGAMGISQLMPDEARRFRVDPFDPVEAIGAQAALMREHLARFGSVPLALAAYNAGPNAVAGCGCVPPYRETQAYVRRILGWLGDRSTGPIVRLVA